MHAYIFEVESLCIPYYLKGLNVQATFLGLDQLNNNDFHVYPEVDALNLLQ
jgi:hypothetical protein